MTATVEAGTPAASATAGQRRWRRDLVPRLLFAVLFLTTWQLVVPFLPTQQIPTPLTVGAFMIAELRGDTVAPASVYASFQVTLLRLAVGLLISMVLGVAVGVAMGTSRRIDAMLHDFVIGALALPYVIWALILAMWLGFGFWTPVIVVVLAAVPFVITNVAEGVRDVPKQLVDMARSYGVPQARLLRRLVVPSLMPFVFASFRYALSLGWKALAVAEVFGAMEGAGWMLRFWYQSRRPAGLFAYLGFFVIFAIVMDYVVLRGMSKRFFRWRPAASD